MSDNDTELLGNSKEVRSESYNIPIVEVPIVSQEQPALPAEETNAASLPQENPEYLNEARQQLTNLTIMSAQQKFSERIAQDIKLQGETAEKVWKPVIENKHHQELDKAYHEISPARLPFFDVLDQGKFTDQTKINFGELASRYHISTVPRWDGSEIDKMFGKGLNPTSLITSLESAEWFEKNLSNKVNPTVVELGTGAGWGSVMLFNTLKEKNPEQKIRQFSVDMSAHAIAATETLLNYSGIPYITVEDGVELVQIQKWLEENPEGIKFSGVILVLDKFNDAISHFQDNSVDGIYSSHGTAYLSRNEYADLLKKSSDVLGQGGLFIADSLDPRFTNKLDTIFTLRQIANPDGMKKKLDEKGIQYIYSNEKMKNNSKYFPGEEVQIFKGFNTEHSYLILKWCNHLLRNLEVKRLKRTIESLTVTMKVVDDYRADVFPSFLLNGVIQENSLQFEELEGRPNFPLFMDTRGFRLTTK